MKKMFAFTLSEVLITLAIIGVISALTVPTLINGYQKKAEVVQIRKVMTDIGNTIDMYITEEGKAKFSATPYYKNDLNSLITEKMKSVKTCSSDAGGCFASENYLTIGGGDSKAFSCEGNSYLLANSAAICMTKDDDIITVNVDINGQQGPNIGGRDMFEFYVTKDGDIAYCSDGNAECDSEKEGCTGSALGKGCVKALADNAWVMDY